MLVVVTTILMQVLKIMMVPFFVPTISKFYQERFFPSFTRPAIELFNDLLTFVSRFHSI